MRRGADLTPRPLSASERGRSIQNGGAAPFGAAPPFWFHFSVRHASQTATLATPAQANERCCGRDTFGRRMAMAESENLRRGEEVRRQLGMDLGASSHRYDDIDPEFSAEIDKYLSEACFGGAWARPGLDLKTRRLLTLAMVAALGRER